jgi:hypothetical protein
MTLHRHGTPAHVTGSARHGQYSSFDSIGAKYAVRNSYSIARDSLVWGWFGQPLQAFDGYRRTINCWTNEIAALQGNATILYRPHPRETVVEQIWTQQLLLRSGKRVVLVEGCSTEEALAACDTMSTILSNCAYDAAYLNFFSSAPVLVPLLLLFDAELRDFYYHTLNIRHLPYVEKHLAIPVWRENDLAEVLHSSTEPETRYALWCAARSVLSNPSQSVSRVLDALWTLGWS